MFVSRELLVVETRQSAGVEVWKVVAGVACGGRLDMREVTYYTDLIYGVCWLFVLSLFGVGIGELTVFIVSWSLTDSLCN